jgi:hypothetical protein
MNALIRGLVRDAIAPIGEMEARLFKQAILLLFVLSCLFVALIFLTIAFYAFIETLAGAAIAALSAAGLYLVAAFIGLALMPRTSKAAAPKPGYVPFAAPAQDGQEAAAEEARRPELAANIDGALAPVLDLLRESGFQRERSTLEAGAAIAKRLNPLSLVAFSLFAGFLLGCAPSASKAPGGEAPPSRKDVG